MTIRRFVTTRTTLVGILTAAALGAVLGLPRPTSASVHEAAPETPAHEAGLPVATRLVTEQDSYRQARVYTGEVVARRSTELSFERLGKVVRIPYDDGSRVNQGDAVAELDVRDLELQQRETKARLDQARAQLEEMENGPRRQTIEAARERVRDLEAQLGLSRVNLQRVERLLEKKAIGKEGYDEVAFGSRALKARLAAAQQELDELVEGTRKERITAQRALVDQLDARVVAVELDIEKSTIRAPFAGRIEHRHVDEGAVVSALEPVVRLIESDVLEARVGVPVAATTTLKTGAEHTVRIGNAEWKARLSAILPHVDRRTRTRTLVLDLDPSAAGVVAPGEIARLRLEETVPERGIWVPNAALSKSLRGLWSVYVVRDGRIERQEVEVLTTRGDRVFVRGTLRSGHQLVVGGTHRLVPGQQVRTTEEG